MKMKNLIYFIIISCLLSCNSKHEKIKGDLFFKLVNISSPSGMSPEEISKIENMLENVKKSDDELIAYLKNLKSNNVLGNPYLQLKIGDDIKTVFITHKEFQKISTYTLKDLQQQNKKVEIELKVKKLEKGIFFSNEIISIKEVDGETPWQK